ncbi:MAG: nickel pincer cofactor biosynthesis protein LarC [Armatimonadota bacterium]|nr:nickel pincer cofactor biosynthesis protein LarC [Armatimonadota bacterium]
MKVAYFDLFCGISGDMALGALIDAGADVDALRAELAKLGLSGWELEVEKVVKRGVSASSVSIIAEDEHAERGIVEIRQLIEASDLSERVKSDSLAVFSRLAEAEAKIHGVPVERIHFHELGAVDTIIDIVGVCVCLEMLRVRHVYASAVPTFHGSVKTRHGVLPLPAPATLELLKNAPWRELGVEGEIVTPTGAALLAVLAKSFGPMPAMRITSIGWGAGKMDLDVPNVLRVLIGDEVSADLSDCDAECQTREQGESSHGELETVAILETNIDDLSPQVYELLMDRLFAEGALDVYLTPIQMKKSRPAVLVSIICSPELVDRLSDILFAETSTLGIRVDYRKRICLAREHLTVDTPYGRIRIKVARRAGQVVNAQPEYEDCKSAAAAAGVPLKMVQNAAIAAFFASRHLTSSAQP